MRIAAVAGRLRLTSYNKGLLRAAAELAPADVLVEILDLAAVPLFNQDLERRACLRPSRACAHG
jgi:NAD(P)H-dependent FMN reductase